MKIELINNARYSSPSILNSKTYLTLQIIIDEYLENEIIVISNKISEQMNKTFYI